MVTVRLAQLTDPSDPRLRQLSVLMDAIFADPNIVLGLDRMQQFLADNRPGAARRFCVLVAEQDDAVVGGCVFSYVVRSNCGFSEYIVADRRVRGQGIGRALFDARKRMLDTEARKHGHDRCSGLFIEVDSPHRTPADYIEAERATALDVRERLRVFAHLGFQRVDAPYVQPPLAPDKVAIDYLDLLFAAWHSGAAERNRIPAEWIFDTVEAIWSAWTPDTFSFHLETLKRRVIIAEVALLDPLEGIS